MRVQHNISAMNSYRNYNNNTSSINKNLEKLSSGYKINRAGDDAAGLAISEKMRAQITGLKTAQKNAKDGISLVQTAEGALTEVHTMLNRMYELAEQSANGTYAGTDNASGSSAIDRQQLQEEVTQLRSEINRIVDSSNFNGVKLFTGGASEADGTDGTDGATLTAKLTKTTNVSAVKLGSKGSAGDEIKYWFAEGDGDKKGTLYADVGSVHYSANIDTVPLQDSYKLDEIGGTDQITITLTSAGKTQGAGAISSTNPTAADTIGTVKGSGGDDGGDDDGGDDDGGDDLAAGKVTLQIGDTGDSFNQMKIDPMDMSETTLKIDSASVDITEQSKALSSLDNIKDAINQVSKYRGQLGAVQNRLEHTINNLSTMQENLQDAESTIRDTDVADEMMAYTKNSILVQSAQAMLAQANQQPQGVLQLLQ